MQAGTEAKAMEEYYLLACYPWLAPPASCTTQQSCPEVTMFRVDWYSHIHH